MKNFYKFIVLGIDNKNKSDKIITSLTDIILKLLRMHYSFLKDPRALAEIRKHKWIESQKANREIGFATAAVDWIKNYGQQWKRIHVQDDADRSVFIERRKYRRFRMETCAELIKESRYFLARIININFFGLLCRSSEYFPPGKETVLKLRFKPYKEEVISCRAVIQRVIVTNQDEYEMFLEFDRCGQRQLTLLKHQRIFSDSLQ